MQGVPKRGPRDHRMGPNTPIGRNPGTPIGTPIDKPRLQFTFDGGLVVAERAGPRPGLLCGPDVVVAVEAAEEALADVGEALARHAHVPLAHAQRLHQQLGGVLQVLHRNLDREIRVSWCSLT